MHADFKYFDIAIINISEMRKIEGRKHLRNEEH